MTSSRRRRFAAAGFLAALLWSAGARAQMADGELGARLSFLLLIPLGVVHVLAAAKVGALLPRPKTRLTAALALASVGAGLAGAVGEASPQAIRWLVAALGCVPSLPTAIGLGRARSWGMLVVAAVIPSAAGVFLALA